MSFHVPNEYRLIDAGPLKSDGTFGNNGVFIVPYNNGQFSLYCVASDDMGWEHVSVSLKRRCPRWEEMCYIKKLFWDDEDTVIQFHPPESEYVNCHPHCLHLWRPIGIEVPRPPSLMVGI